MIFERYIQKKVDSLRPQIHQEEREKVLKEQNEIKSTAWKQDCDLLFNDGTYNYFKYKDHKVIPLERLKYVHATEILLDSRLNNDELNTLIEIGIEASSKAVNQIKQDNRIENLNVIHWAFQEMKARKDRLMFHPTLLVELAAYTIIREDENPGEINMAIHEQKIQLFKTKGGDIPFLLQGNIGKALIKPEKYLQSIAALWDITLSEIGYEGEAYKKILTNLRSGNT